MRQLKAYIQLFTRYSYRVNKVLIALLFVGTLTQSLFFVQVNRAPYDWDAASHLEAALHYFHYLENEDYYNYFFSYYFYPPFAYQLFAFLYFFTHSLSYSTIVLHFLVLTVLGLLAKYHLDSRSTYQLFFSIVLFFFLAVFFEGGEYSAYNLYIWNFMLDLTAISFVVLTYLTAYRYHMTPSAKAALLFSLMSAFSLYTRIQTVFVLPLPFFLFIYTVIRKQRATDLQLFGLSQVIPFTWYWLNLEHIREYSQIGLFDTNDLRATTGVNGLLLYGKLLLPFMKHLWFLYSTFWLLLLHNIYLAAKRSIKISKKLQLDHIFFLGSFIDFIFLWLIPNKHFRLIFPALILFSVGVGLNIARQNKHLALILASIILLLSLQRIILLSPEPPRNEYAFNFVHDFVKSNPTASSAYYFEYDSVSFNLNNIRLLNLQEKTNFIPSNNPNYYTTYDAQRSCNFHSEIHYWIVYLKPPDLYVTDYYPFDQYCDWVVKEYNLIPLYQVSFPTGERLKIFRNPNMKH